MANRRITAKTPIELYEKVYRANGWVRAQGESRSQRVMNYYEVSIEKDRFCAVELDEPRDWDGLQEMRNRIGK